jgi:hypothetical protein
MTSKLSNPKYPSPKNNFNSMQNDPDFLLTQCDGNTNLAGDSSEIDYFFNQKSPYKFPSIIICDDSKRINVNNDIYQKYSDIIIDDCGNRFNIRNLNNSAGLLQEGYSRNIDLDSHLKNINFYNDKCFYDNWKINPNSVADNCNGLKRNEKILVNDYIPVGKRSDECIGNIVDNINDNNINNNNNSINCFNTPPTDINNENNIRKRYNFNYNKFNKETCIKSSDRISFKLTPVEKINNLDKYPNTQRTIELLNTINPGVKYDYYKFFDDNKCIHYPAQRLFNNNTSRKATPNHHNIYNIEPKYLA